MGIIAKGYTAVIIDGATIDSSDVIAAFDAIYDVVNGGIDGANVAVTFAASASGITINDPLGNVSATKASLIGPEITLKGYNTIHTIGLGTAGFDIFPGVIEHNGRYCTLNSRLHISGINNIQIVNSSSDVVWMLTVGQAAILTASDFRLESYTATTVAIYSLVKDAYYTTASRRAICTFMCNITASVNDSYFNDEYFQRPAMGHRYLLQSSEAISCGFNSNAPVIAVSNCNNWSSIYQIFDMNENRYFFDVHGTNPSATSNACLVFSGYGRLGETNVTQTGFGYIGPSGSIQHHWYVEHSLVNGVSTRSVEGAVGFLLGGSTATFNVLLGQNNLSLISKEPNLNSGTFFLRIKRRADSLRRQT